MEKDRLAKELSEVLIEIKTLMKNNRWDNSKTNQELWNKMVDFAHNLDRIVKPIHHSYMIKNRGVAQIEPEFYNHIHPVEDLLAYMKDPHANDDPADLTINHDFYLQIFSRRWGHDDKYTIKRTEHGWEIGNISIFGVCDKSGKPYLFENLDHNNVNYPEALPEYMEWLWEQAAEKGLTHEQVQESLNLLSNWINDCETNSPQGIWEYYK